MPTGIATVSFQPSMPQLGPETRAATLGTSGFAAEAGVAAAAGAGGAAAAGAAAAAASAVAVVAVVAVVVATSAIAAVGAVGAAGLDIASWGLPDMSPGSPAPSRGALPGMLPVVSSLRGIALRRAFEALLGSGSGVDLSGTGSVRCPAEKLSCEVKASSTRAVTARPKKKRSAEAKAPRGALETACIASFRSLA